MESERVLLDRFDPLDRAQIVEAVGSVLGIERIIDGELDIFCGHLLAVMKLDTLAQFERIELTVLRNFPRLGKTRLDGAVEISREQGLKHELTNSRLGRARVDQR